MTRCDSGYKKAAWYVALRARMVAGHERCRGCGRTVKHRSVDPQGLAIGHIRAWALDRSSVQANLTVVCRPCDILMGDGDWTGLIAPVTEKSWTPAWPPDPPQRTRRPRALTYRLDETVAERLLAALEVAS